MKAPAGWIIFAKDGGKKTELAVQVSKITHITSTDAGGCRVWYGAQEDDYWPVDVTIGEMLKMIGAQPSISEQLEEWLLKKKK